MTYVYISTFLPGYALPEQNRDKAVPVNWKLERPAQHTPCRDTQRLSMLGTAHKACKHALHGLGEQGHTPSHTYAGCNNQACNSSPTHRLGVNSGVVCICSPSLSGKSAVPKDRQSPGLCQGPRPPGMA